MSATAREFMAAMESIAPLSLAESWDNVGLLIGAMDTPVRSVMLTIDLTEAVLDEAIQSGANCILTYHPVLFKPTRSLTDHPEQALLLRAIENKIIVFSPHTALDAAEDGLTDWLAASVGQGYRRPLLFHETLALTQEVKITTFVPTDHLDHLRDVMASAGAGRIGQYEICSFHTVGIGSFRGKEGTKPAIGSAQTLEAVSEARLEMVAPRNALHVIVSALRQFHPYEEPAIDVYPLHAIPDEMVGQGRKIVLDQIASVGEIAQRVKDHLGIKAVKCTDPSFKVREIGVIPGSGGDHLETAIVEGCQLFITGELTYHLALGAWRRGISIILTGHSNSERGFLPILRDRLAKILPDVEFAVASTDRTFFEIV